MDNEMMLKEIANLKKKMNELMIAQSKFFEDRTDNLASENAIMQDSLSAQDELLAQLLLD